MTHPNSSLIALASTRAIRERLSSAPDGFLPHFCTLEEFFKSAKYIPNRARASKIVRKILLRRSAIGVVGATELGFETEFLRFLRNNDFLFRFFDELFAEEVAFDKLVINDAYAKFDDHLGVLKAVWERYTALLDEHNLFDGSHPNEFLINRSYIDSFSDITLYLGGYATKKELRLLNEVARLKPLKVIVSVNAYNERMRQRLTEDGFEVSKNGRYELNWNDKTAEFLGERAFACDMQTVCALRKIDQAVIAIDLSMEWAQSGLRVEKIAIVTADEEFAQTLKVLDEQRNLNFAMGLKDYEATNKLKALLKTNLQNVEELFEALNEPIFENAIEAAKEALKFDETLGWRELGHIILSELDEVDDVGGGKITVMGLLETRGAEFDGLIFLDFDDANAPKPSQKDLFLTTDIKKRSGLPTRIDREGLQAFYYSLAISSTKKTAFVYSGLPSPFIKLLGLPSAVNINEACATHFKSEQKSKNEDFTLKSVNLKQTVWSHTKLKTYFTCKRKFYFKYIEYIQEDDPLDKESQIRKLGEKFHIIIRDNPSASKKDILKKLLENEISETFKMEVRKLSFALDAFCAAQKKLIKDGWQTKFCEKEFTAELYGFKFKAFIDRIDEKDGEFLIIDYKLGANVKIDLPKDELKRADFQLPIYALCAGKPLEQTKAFLWAINDEAQIYEPNLQRACEILEQKLSEMPEFESVFELCEKLGACRFCGYKILCERES